MSWKVNDKEFDSVLHLPAPRRYSYFIKRVADWQQVVGLSSERGWALAADDESHEVVPVWPHERYAAACAQEQWADHEPRAIRLSDWIDRWLPGMAKVGRLAAVFPTPDKQGVVVSPERLRSDLETELANYE